MVRIFPRASEEEAVRALLAEALGLTRAQPGCLGCTVATEFDPPAILYMEIWQSRNDLMTRLHSAEYAKILATMNLSTTKPDISIYEIIDQRGLEMIETIRMARHDTERKGR